MLHHILGLLSHPHSEWDKINGEIRDRGHDYIWHLLILAAIPGVASLIGATHVGWSLTGLDPIRLTVGSALAMSLISYLAIIGAVITMGMFTHWMAKTFGTAPSYQRCIMFAAYVATPLYLCGLMALYPSLPLTLFGILAGIAYAVYLLYIGMPHIMGISFERGFMFATSLVCAGLVLLVVMKVASAMAWQIGFGPVFMH
ncbi:YIP1 family protein [Sansalvadorimonas sp. 2012CJ34-2]|uniref:YIP1 family protein n=1 Tax=Parendozoicomonas callyspongiae TaxID=2942213 RepID=A0ABT0PIU1_9GAMM|nr:Yip1 family protein [Sansalvadorimonas sp. 2012CJ34-2]MCL6271307.1 YIP1 family protein [Sansalvadorimonas sp. 2012CJ34-2]